MNSTSLIVAALYLFAVLGIAGWAVRRTATVRDFYIAGQGLGVVVATLATLSAAFSGFVFLGGPGLMYRLGIDSLWICLPVGFTSTLLCWVVAGRLRRIAGVRQVFTIPDAIHARFADRGSSGAAAVAVLLGSVAYVAAQFLALSVMVRFFAPAGAAMSGDGSVRWLVILAGLAVVGYSVGGGMLAGVYTDVVQGLLMIGTAIAVFFYAWKAGGGLSAMAESIRGSPEFGEGFLQPLGSAPLLTGLGFFFVFGVGTLGQPQMLHKFFMLKDVRSLRFMPWALGLGQSFCLLIWLGIGLAVPALVAQGKLAPPAAPDQATPAFLAAFAPNILTGLVAAGILAAIMSSVDSFLNLASAALVRDLPRALRGRPVKCELFWGRLATLAVAGAAGLFALAFDDLIALLGTLAFGTFAAALTPTMTLGLSWRRVTHQAATASILAGTVLNLGIEFLQRQQLFESWPRATLAPGALPSAFALAASFAVLIVVTLLTADRSDELPPDLARIVEPPENPVIRGASRAFRPGQR